MKLISHKTNPTGLRNIDRNLATIRFDSESFPPKFKVERLDLEGAKLEDGLLIVLMVEAGNSKFRKIVGITGPSAEIDDNWIESVDLDNTAPFTFRIAFRKPVDPIIIASIDGIRPKYLSGSESLIEMARVDLGEKVWVLKLNETRPVLQINSRIFPSTSGAESYIPFSAIVLPEVLARCLEKICKDRSILESDTEWAEWKGFIEKFGLEIPEDGDDNSTAEFIDDVVEKFCKKNTFASKLKNMLYGDNSNG
jgi:hypothetical protein